MKTAHFVARTFFSVLSCRACLTHLITHTCVWLKGLMTQVTGVRCASQITASHSMFHKTLLGVPDTFSTFCSSPSQTAPTTRPLTGIRSTPCATSPEGRQSLYLAETLPHTNQPHSTPHHTPHTTHHTPHTTTTVWIPRGALLSCTPSTRSFCTHLKKGFRRDWDHHTVSCRLLRGTVLQNVREIVIEKKWNPSPHKTRPGRKESRQIVSKLSESRQSTMSERAVQSEIRDLFPIERSKERCQINGDLDV